MTAGLRLVEERGYQEQVALNTAREQVVYYERVHKLQVSRSCGRSSVPAAQLIGYQHSADETGWERGIRTC